MAVMRANSMGRPRSWGTTGHIALAALGLMLHAYAVIAIGINALPRLALGVLVVAAIVAATTNLIFDRKLKSPPVPTLLIDLMLVFVGALSVKACMQV